MTTIGDIQASGSPPAHMSCADCRFGAGYPRGPQRLMRCVNPGHPTCGQFLRGPVACERFEASGERPRQGHVPAAPDWARCGDCEHADLFTVEPACACSSIALGSHRRVRRLDAPACESFEPRRHTDLTLQAWDNAGVV